MKSILPALLMTMIVTGTKAQTRGNEQASAILKKAQILSSTESGRHKATNIRWRLIGASSYEDVGNRLDMVDSTAYAYANGRGSHFEDIQFYLNDYGFESPVHYDTAFKYYDLGSGTELQDMYVFNYDAQDRKMHYTYLFQPVTGPMEEYYHEAVVRDANGNIIKRYSITWEQSLQKWDTTGIGVMTYDSHNHMLTDSSSTKVNNVFLPAGKSVYTYDASGNRIEWLRLSPMGTTLDTSYKSISTYDSRNKLTAGIYMRYEQGAWKNHMRDSNLYNSAGVLHYHATQQWNTVTQEWEYTDKQERILDNHGVVTSVAFSLWDTATAAWDRNADVDVTYDNNGNNTRLVIYLYDGGVRHTFPFSVTNYYYEQYGSVGINDKAVTRNAATIYPNPASGYVNLVLDNNKGTDVSLLNMGGQVVRSAQVPAGTSKLTMDINGLLPGNYIMTLSSAGVPAERHKISVR